MATDQYLVAIDVGSSSVKLAVANRNLDEKNKAQIFALLERPTFGIRKGVITDMTEVSRAVYDIVTEATAIIGMNIQEVLVGINNFGVNFVNSDGYVPLSGQEVSEDDVDRVVYDSLKKAFNLREKEILQYFPLSFALDNQTGIRNPLGMVGDKLSCRTLTITAEPSGIRNFTRIFQQAELDILDKLFMPLVASDMTLTNRQKQVGAIMVDIGYSTTTYVVWDNEEILGSGVLNIGSEKITSDIAYCAKTSIEIAEEIKKERVDLNKLNGDSSTNEEESIEIFDPETQTNYNLNMSEIQYCASQRVEEIFLLLLKKLFEQFGQSKFPGGIVLTGGGANLKGIHEIAKQVTGLPVYTNIYNERDIKFILEFDNDPSYANVISMLVYALNHPEELGQDKNIFDQLNSTPAYQSNHRRPANRGNQKSNSGFWSNIRNILPF